MRGRCRRRQRRRGLGFDPQSLQQIAVRHDPRQNPPAHPSGRGRIKVLFPEERPGRAFRQNDPVKDHPAPIRRFPAKVHIMGNDHYRGPLFFEGLQPPDQALFGHLIHPFGRLIQQKDVRIFQHHLRQSQPLLLSAGQVIGVDLQDLLQFPPTGRFHRCLPSLREWEITQHLLQLQLRCLSSEKGRGFLGYHGSGPADPDLSPLRFQDPRRIHHHSGLSRSVPAQDSADLTGSGVPLQSLQDVRRLLFVAEPDLIQRQDRSLRRFLSHSIFFRQDPPAGFFHSIDQSGQPVPALPDRHRAYRIRQLPQGGLHHRSKDPHGHRQHPVKDRTLLTQLFFHLAGRPLRQDPALFHGQDPVRQGQYFFQPVFRQDDGGPQFLMDFFQGSQELLRSDGIQPAGGFIQYQHLRLQDHSRCQAEDLLLAAGQGVYVPVEPLLHPKEGSGLRRSGPHVRLVHPHALQSEDQLMPDLVADDAVFRILQDETDTSCRFALFQGPAIHPDLSLPKAMGHQLRLQMPKQRGLSAPGGPKEHQKLPGFHGEIDSPKRRLLSAGILKCQLFDSKAFHWIFSRISMSKGKAHSNPYARKMVAVYTPPVAA